MTDVSNRKRQPKGAPASAGGEFANNSHDEASQGLTCDLASQEPVEIDGQLADLYGHIWQYRRQRSDTETHLEKHRALRRRQNREPDEKIVAKYEESISAYDEKLAELRSEAQPFHDEFDRRGGWTRAFLVLNNDGHVHASRSCQHIRPTTRVGWMTEYSGKSQDEVIEDAGEMACTTCFPDAPTRPSFSQPSKILDAEAEAARSAAAEAKAERDRTKAEKGITTPSGGLLTVGGFHVRTEVTAMSRMKSEIQDLIEDRLRPFPNRDFTISTRDNISLLEEALAHKRGSSVDEIRAEAYDKAVKSFKRDFSDLITSDNPIPALEDLDIDK